MFSVAHEGLGANRGKHTFCCWELRLLSAHGLGSFTKLDVFFSECCLHWDLGCVM